MKTLKDYVDYLNYYFKQHKTNISEDSVDGIICSVDFSVDGEELVILDIIYQEDYEREIMNFSGQYTIDYSRIDVVTACIKCDGIKYGDTNNGFCLCKDCGNLKYFKDVISIISNIDVFEYEVLKAHLDNVEHILINFRSILTEFGFFPRISTLLDADEKINSCPEILYTYKFDNNYGLLFETDLLTKKLECSDLDSTDVCSLSEDEFKERLVKYMYNNGDTPLCFEYYFKNEEGYTRESYPEIIKLMYRSANKDLRNDEEIDFSKIPEIYIKEFA